MGIKRLLLLLFTLQYIMFFTQSCIYINIKNAKKDSIVVEFKNMCEKEFLLYRYDNKYSVFNEAYDLEEIVLKTKKKYKLIKIINGSSYNELSDFDLIKDGFFLLKSNEIYQFSIPLNIFLKKDKIKYERLSNYYLIDDDSIGKKYINFRLKYNPKFIEENLISLPDSLNLYNKTIISNKFQIILE